MIFLALLPWWLLDLGIGLDSYGIWQLPFPSVLLWRVRLLLVGFSLAVGALGLIFSKSHPRGFMAWLKAGVGAGFLYGPLVVILLTPAPWDLSFLSGLLPFAGLLHLSGILVMAHFSGYRNLRFYAQGLVAVVALAGYVVGNSLSIWPYIAFPWMAIMGGIALYLRLGERRFLKTYVGETTAAPVWAFGLYSISDREKDVVLSSAQGLTNQEIAEKLFISLSTVKTHMASVFQKTQARNRVEMLKKLRNPPLG